MPYKIGQKVTCNGNKDAYVVGVETNFNGDGFTMYTVRLWDSLRHVGDVCVSESELDTENNVATPIADSDLGKVFQRWEWSGYPNPLARP